MIDVKNIIWTSVLTMMSIAVSVICAVLGFFEIALIVVISAIPLSILSMKEGNKSWMK